VYQCGNPLALLDAAPWDENNHGAAQIHVVRIPPARQTAEGCLTAKSTHFLAKMRQTPLWAKV